MIAIRHLASICIIAAVAADTFPITAFGYQASGPTNGGNTLNFGPTDVVPHLSAANQTTVNVNGSTVSWSYFYENSAVNVTGNADISWMHLYDNSTANIHDGDISWLKLYQSSRANLRSVDQLSWLLLNDESQAHIYGTDFRYGGGHLSGKWANGVSFSFWALNENDLANPSSNRSIAPAGLHFHVVPEPVSGGLAAAATAFALLRLKKRNPNTASGNR